MNNTGGGESGVLSRRSFCRGALAGALGIGLGGGLAFGGGGEVKLYKNLGPGHIGVRANQRESLAYAVKYGFDSITPSAGEFERASDAQIQDWLGVMKGKGIRYGAGGLPVEYRRSEEQFKNGLEGLPRQAGVLQKLGVTRVATWITPGHRELTYLGNFELHKRRLREAAKILKDHEIRLGLEFVGPRTSRSRSRYPFICTQAGMMELVGAIGTGNVGLLLDSWHWYTSHGTVEELLELKCEDVVHVHVNDAPSGIEVDKQVDSRRRLPVTTGVIDMKGFVNALVKVGYDGPVECEPFDRELSSGDDEAAVKKTAEALERLWGLIAV
ncbi:MAG: sugar phosphate isomerase/epimerase [Sedimentisphaerales bacterium]|nr:sugar phosphate isomerase/epimerase [Sedimentisphaerales bacterium]